LNGGDRRIYHTGDLGRLRADGLLYHLGRKDFQLKINGYRVEPGEIEAVLLAQDNVKQVVVGMGKPSTKTDSDRLIAYIVPSERPLPSTPALRRALKKKLPVCMVPSDFVFLTALPLTPNGKIDRRSLPPAGNARAELETPYVAPRSNVEKHLARIWSGVLGVRVVGIHDDFFDLGGHSLAAMRVVSQVIQQFRLELPLQSLFHSATIDAMAAVIVAHQEKRLGENDLENLLGELEALSDEDVQQLLAAETNPTNGGERHD
jgi:acyl carrier protein